MPEIFEINTVEGLKEIEGAWNDLLGSAGSDCIFLTYEWLSTWWKYFGAGKQLFVLTVKEGGEITGIAPWVIRGVWNGRTGFRKIEFLGTGLSDWLDFIIPDRKREHFELILQYLLERNKVWDIIDLRELPSSSENAAVLQEVLKRKGVVYRTFQDSIRPYISIETDWDSFLKGRFSGKTRWTMRKTEKRLQNAGIVKIRIIRDLSEGPDTIQRIARMPQSEFYRGKKRGGLFDNPAKKGFFEEIISRFSRMGWVYIPLLELSDSLVAYRLDFRFRDKYYGYFLGFDPEFSFCAPGKVLMTRLIKECFDSGVKEFDFLRGDEAYKFEWTDRYHQNLRMMLFPHSLRGRLLNLGYMTKQALAERSGKMTV